MIITNFKQLESFRNKSGIYLFTDKLYPNKRYAGKAYNRLYGRIAIEHKNGQGYKTQYIDRIIKQYGLLERFNIELIHWWDETVDKWEVLALEVAVIDAYDCLVNKGGYNILLFNFDRTGTKASLETKEKLSKFWKEKYKNGYISKNKGKKASLETKLKQSKNSARNNLGKIGCLNHLFGTHSSIETRNKQSESQKGNKNHNFGKHASSETKEKQRLAMLGRKFSSETIQRMKENHVGMLGKKHTEKTKKELSILFTGKNNPNFNNHPSEKTKMRMGMKNKISVKQIDIKTGIIIKIYSSLIEAAKEMKLKNSTPICMVLKNKYKSSCGFK